MKQVHSDVWELNLPFPKHQSAMVIDFDLMDHVDVDYPEGVLPA